MAGTRAVGQVREVVIWADGVERTIRIRGAVDVLMWSSWRHAANRFLQDNDTRHLDLVRGTVVKDISGRMYQLETRPNVLYRLDAAGRGNFEQIYKIVS
jgi:hypothetical protein